MNKPRLTLFGNDSNGNLYKADTIEHDGKLWIVPLWHDVHGSGIRKPARMIRMDNLEHQQTGGSFGVDFMLNKPLPWDLLQFDRPAMPTLDYEVLELPDIEFPIPGKLN